MLNNRLKKLYKLENFVKANKSQIRKDDFMNIKENLKIIIILVLALIVFATGYYAYSLREKYLNSLENNYNRSFSEAVNLINNIENFLAKAQITKNSEFSAETLTDVWNDANLAIIYLSEIPFDSEGSSKTIKFLNQVSDYSYLLSKKNFNKQDLTDEDFENLSKLYAYTKDLELVLNQLSTELYSKKISWKQLQNNYSTMYAQEVDNISEFSNIDSTFDEYEGLIYDGAYSEHLDRNEKRGLKGEDIDENIAMEKVKEYVEDVEEIISRGFIENADIPVYTFDVKVKNSNSKYYVEISKTGGLLVQLNNSRDVNEEKISQEEANEIGKEYLKNIGFSNMKETYFTKLENVLTVNYAYVQDDVVVYPDLIKVKIGLDTGEILGVETKGFLNCHYEREFNDSKVSVAEAKLGLNSHLEFISEGKAIIPTENGIEVLCYEFKGKIEDKEFLVYVNTETGEEENILIILETEGGTLTV